MTFNLIASEGVPIKAWTQGVPVEDDAKAQLQRIAKLPVVWPHVAVMPDVHLGKGATVGSVIPTKGAIIPAAVGVDLGCGMLAVKLSIAAKDLPDTLAPMRSAIEASVPHGRTNNGGPGDKGAWTEDTLPSEVADAWLGMRAAYQRMHEKHPGMLAKTTYAQLCSLGTGNHFIEVCLDTEDNVWVMLHTGSRGPGNRIGSYFIELAKKDMEAAYGYLPEDKELAYLDEGTEHFADYVEAVSWAQDFARVNRVLMLQRVMGAINAVMPMAVLRSFENAVNCHHNYVAREEHYGSQVYVTRKGAVSARAGELGIIPGSMGAKSFIVRGKGNPDALCSCSHGAGRVMSRGEAKRRFSVEDHVKATEGIECRKDAEVIDETPGAYKDIDAVMAAQSDLVEVVATLRQVLVVKG
jgi:tRNA-splicing ligase RtcB